jgi:hypothetical protein
MAANTPVGKDLYLRSPNDPNFIAGVYESNDPIENAVQQVRMVLLTKPGEVLGEDIGFNAEGYLFEFEGFNLNTLENDANSQITEYVLLAKPYQITAKAFTLKDNANSYRVGLGLDIAIDGQSAFAALFDH